MIPGARGRVCIIGLDCVTPQLLFDDYHDRLPTFARLMATGLWGPLTATIPPVTVPAWASMTTGLDPGSLGVYGFHDRTDHTYDSPRRLPSSLSFDAPPLWSRLARAGARCTVLGVPQTYPPKPLRHGRMVSGFLTPGPDVPWTYPPELAAELSARFGPPRFDVDEFRCDEANEERLLADIRAGTRQRFDIAEALLDAGDWDFFMMVDIGPDRLQHAYWRYARDDHPDYRPGHRFEHVLRDCYVELDRRVGRICARLGAGDLLLVVSDHGAQAMHGGFVLNDWLRQHGYLTLTAQPRAPGPLAVAQVDWRRTRVFADGGYVGRIRFNVAGREPAGIVAPEDVPALAATLAGELGALRKPDGSPVPARIYWPAEIYRELRGVPPDGIVYCDELRWRVLGGVGYPSLFVRDNDTGPDGANHAQQGVLLLRDGERRGTRAGLSIYDVAPTALAWAGCEIPAAMDGAVIR